MNENEYIIDSELDTKGVEKGASKIGYVMNKLAKKMSDVAQKQKKSFEKTSLNTEEYEKLENEYQKIEDKIQRVMKAQDRFMATFGDSSTMKKQQYDIEQLEKSQEKLIEQMQEMQKSGIAYSQKPSSTYAELEKTYYTLDAKLSKLIKTQERFLSTGGKTKSSAYKKQQYDLEQLQQQQDKVFRDMERMEKNGTAQNIVPTHEYAILQKELDNVVSKLERVKSSQQRLMETSGIDSSTTYRKMQYDLEQLEIEQGNVVAKMEELNAESSGLTGFSKNVMNVASKFHILRSSINLVKKGFLGLIKIVSKIGSAFSGMFKHLNKSNKGFGSGIKNILKYALGIRSLFVLVNKLRSALVEGFKNLAQFNNGVNPTNTAISNLQSALTQLKNSFATAFAPILQVIEPILTRLISLINQAVTAFGMLIATLTGKSTFTRATKVQSDYAKSLDKSAGSAKKLKSQLLGIDELNVLNSNDDSSGGAGTDPNSMFENVDIPDKFKNIAQWLKDMWKNADFTELGAILGQKLKEALDSINWKSIQNTARKIGKSIATLINGFVESNELGLSIGKTIGEAFNTAIYFLQSFVQNLHWDSVGNFIAEAINGFFSTIDWSALGNTLSTGIKGLLDGTIELVKNTDFDAIFKAIGDFLKGFDTSEILASLSELVGEILGELVSLLVKGILDIGNSMHDYFEPFIESAKEEGKSVASGILEGIGELFKDIGTWLKENIFDPFVDGFKALFKIESPSKVMEEQGEYIILGLKNGIKNHIDDIIQAISDLKNKILDKFEEIKEKITEKFDIIKKNVNEKLDNINENADKKLKTLKESWSSAWDSMRSKVEDVVSSIKEKFGGLFDDLEDRLDRTSKSMTGGLSNIASGVAGVTPSLSTQSIPHLAKGTVIPRASSQFLAVLGDNSRESEVVSPISTMKQAFLEALEESGNQNVTVNVSLEGDAKDLFRVMRNKSYQFTKKTGKPAFEF